MNEIVPPEVLPLKVKFFFNSVKRDLTDGS